jgi:hypothetical protein
VEDSSPVGPFEADTAIVATSEEATGRSDHDGRDGRVLAPSRWRLIDRSAAWERQWLIHR